MTSGKPGMEQVIRRATALPLARIVAVMLAAATAFFCYAMPQRVLDGLLGAVGVGVPVGIVGRTVFVLAFAVVAAILGWLVVSVAGHGAGLDEIENETDLEEPAPRRRGIGTTAAIESAVASPPIAVRRGDSHPDAPPRRPIFADVELPDLGDPLPIAAEIDAPDPAEPEIDESEPVMPPVIALPEDAVPVVVAEPEPAPEPLELIDSLPPTPVAEPEAPPTLAQLMARFERGLDQRGTDLPPPPDAARIAALRQPEPEPDDTLRSALEALQRMAARQR